MSDRSAQNTIDSMLPVVNSEGEPLKVSRIYDVGQMHGLFLQAWDRGVKTRLDIGRIQMIYDGYPPYDPAKMKASGLAGYANINTGLMKHYITEASRPLVDQINGVQTYVNVVAKTEGDEDLSQFESIVAQEHFNTVSKEPSFNYRKQELVRQYTLFGVVVPYFPDEKDWRWKSENLSNFIIDYNTPCTEDEVQAAWYVRSVKPSFLINKFHHGNKDWDKEALKELLNHMTPKNKRRDSDYLAWETARKENDIYYDRLLPEAEIVYCWVQENNGEISSCIFARDLDGCSKFLYKKEFQFKRQSEAFQLFTYGIPTTGTYHGCRGLGYDSANLVMEINKMVSSFIDALRIQSKMPLKLADENTAQGFQVIEKGPVMLYPGGVESMQMQTVNFAQTTIPGLSVLQSFLSQNVSSYAVEQSSAMGGDARKTKAEIMAKMQMLAAASGGNAELFAQSWERLILEQFRRMIRENYRPEEPGGEQIVAFKRRCKERGVPDNFWKKIDLERCSAVPPVGAGSASQQMMVMERMMEFDSLGWFDAKGSDRMHRHMITLMAGKEAADIYMGEEDIPRPTDEEKWAVIQNGLMSQGQEQPVYENDNNQVHALIHLGSPEAVQPTGSISDDLALIEQAYQSNDEDALIRLAPILLMKIQHAQIHVERMRNAPMAATLRQQLQQVSGTMVNIQRRVQSIERERYQQQMAQAQESEMQGIQDERIRDVGQDWKASQDIARAQFSLFENQAKTDQTLRFNEEKHAQDLRIKDEKAAQDMAIKNAQFAASQL